MLYEPPGQPEPNRWTGPSMVPADAARPDAVDHEWCRDPRSLDRSRALTWEQGSALASQPGPGSRQRSPAPPARRGPPPQPRARRESQCLRRPTLRRCRHPWPAPSSWSSSESQPHHPRRRPSWWSSWPVFLPRVRPRGRVLARAPSSPASSRRRRRAWWTDSSRESNSPWRVRSTRHWSCRVSWRGQRL